MNDLIVKRDWTVEQDWITTAGLRAVVVMTSLGHRCGYVGVPEGHALFEVSYSVDKLADIDVHGGLTYDGDADHYPVESSKLWWFGYDCAHAGDARDLSVCQDVRLRDTFSRTNYGTLRTLEYCIKQCESLATQLNKVL